MSEYKKPELVKYGKITSETTTLAPDGTANASDCILGSCGAPTETDKC